MNIIVNGEPREVPADITVSALCELAGLSGGPVAVERNGDVVPRATHASTVLQEGDELELVHFVGGG